MRFLSLADKIDSVANRVGTFVEKYTEYKKSVESDTKLVEQMKILLNGLRQISTDL